MVAYDVRQVTCVKVTKNLNLMTGSQSQKRADPLAHGSRRTTGQRCGSFGADNRVVQWVGMEQGLGSFKPTLNTDSVCLIKISGRTCRLLVRHLVSDHRKLKQIVENP